MIGSGGKPDKVLKLGGVFMGVTYCMHIVIFVYHFLGEGTMFFS